MSYFSIFLLIWLLCGFIAGIEATIIDKKNREEKLKKIKELYIKQFGKDKEEIFEKVSRKRVTIAFLTLLGCLALIGRLNLLYRRAKGQDI